MYTMSPWLYFLLYWYVYMKGYLPQSILNLGVTIPVYISIAPFALRCLEWAWPSKWEQSRYNLLAT